MGGKKKILLPKKARLRVAGPDHKGIIAHVTTYLFESGCNIEDIDQRILEGFLTMNMVVDVSALNRNQQSFSQGLQKIACSIGMEISCRFDENRAIKNVAILVSHEGDCLETLLKSMHTGQLRCRAASVIGNHNHLRPMSERFGVPFYYFPAAKKKDHERRILNKLAQLDIDLIVLARYMQILSPEFVFRYEGRIINIHPSLLPAFPGPKAYHQAHDKGVEVAGVTAHFVTTNLDEGPIICQGSFKVDRHLDTPTTLKKKGQALEAKILLKAVKLFVDDRLCLRRGKVLDSKYLHRIQGKARDFYD